MSHTNINSMIFDSSSNVYSGSALHTFCNETIPNAFTNSTTKSLIKTMNVASNDSTLTGQYGKALSCTEIGHSSPSGITAEGNNYGIGYAYREGVSDYIWTRTKTVSGSFYSCVYVVTSNQSAGAEENYNREYYGVLPVLRF